MRLWQSCAEREADREAELWARLSPLRGWGAGSIPAPWGGGKCSLREHGYQVIPPWQLNHRFLPRQGVSHSGSAAWAAPGGEPGLLLGAGLGTTHFLTLQLGSRSRSVGHFTSMGCLPQATPHAGALERGDG